jgi:DNA modification methylase
MAAPRARDAAAEQLGRRCHAVEIDPSYCDVIVERWENLTGGKATREQHG